MPILSVPPVVPSRMAAYHREVPLQTGVKINKIKKITGPGRNLHPVQNQNHKGVKYKRKYPKYVSPGETYSKRILLHIKNTTFFNMSKESIRVFQNIPLLSSELE